MAPKANFGRFSALLCHCCIFLFLGNPIEFAGTALNTHNRYRLYHHAQPLRWSDKLSSEANKLAYQLAQQFSKSNSKRFQVPDEDTVGENIEKFLGETFGCDSTAAMKATDKWYQVLSMSVCNVQGTVLVSWHGCFAYKNSCCCIFSYKSRTALQGCEIIDFCIARATIFDKNNGSPPIPKEILGIDGYCVTLGLIRFLKELNTSCSKYAGFAMFSWKLIFCDTTG